MPTEPMTLDELAIAWRQTHDDMADQSVDLQKQIEELNAQLAEIQEPYRQMLRELELQIRLLSIARGSTYKRDGVEVRFRKAAHRVTYDWRQVDAVGSVLRDIMPETADALAAARKESIGTAGVSVVRVD